MNGPAQNGEVLLGPETYRLVEDRVTAGPLESFSLKGRTEEVKTWRLEEVRAGAERVFRRLSSPLVDREEERQVLHDVYRRAEGPAAACPGVAGRRASR